MPMLDNFNSTVRLQRNLDNSRQMSIEQRLEILTNIVTNILADNKVDRFGLDTNGIQVTKDSYDNQNRLIAYVLQLLESPIFTGNVTAAGFNGSLVGGNKGTIVYQTAPNATGFLSPAADGDIMVLAGGLPTWASFSGMSGGGGGITGVSAASPLTVTGTTLLEINISQATASTPGYLSYSDWNTFNNKQSNLGFIPYNASNPANYISNLTGIITTTGNVTSATTQTGTGTTLVMQLSPALGGIPTTTTPTVGSTSTQIANAAFVSTAITNAIAALVASAPGTLNTLNELATALGDDPNFATTITNLLGTKANLTSPSFITQVTAPIFYGSGSALTNLTSNQIALPTGQFLNEQNLFNNISAAPTSVQPFYVSLGNTQLFTPNTLNNWTPNIAFNSFTPLNTGMTIGSSITISSIVTNGSTAYFSTSLSIDGVAQTVNWSNGTIPTSGTVNSNDIYTYRILKIADSTFKVFASASQLLQSTGSTSTPPASGAVRPVPSYLGQTFLDTSIGTYGMPLICGQVSPPLWIDAAGVVVTGGTQATGSSGSYTPPTNLSGTVRPTPTYVGQPFLDLTIGTYGLPLTCGQVSPAIWIDAAGIVIS